MNSPLNAALASTILDDRIRDAERQRLARRLHARAGADQYPRVTVRLAGERDEAAVRRLEELDRKQLPREPMLVAEVAGRVLAARTLATRHAVADPFLPTSGLVELLDLRSVQLRQEPGGRVRGCRVGRFVRAVTSPIRS